MSAPPLLTAERLTKHYGERRVLDEVSLSLARGERVALMGPSGSGKSTLLNCLGGIDRVDTGEIHFDGRRLPVGEELADFRRRQVGTVFQFFHLLPTLSAEENVALPLHLLGDEPAAVDARVETLLRRVGLLSRREALPGQLSGGEQQRVALARAVAHRPALLLADEPTGALDSQHGEKVLALLRELSEEEGASLLLVTHSREAAGICHRVLHLRDGALRNPPAA